MDKKINIAIVAIILLSGILLRVHAINKYDLWYDELISNRYSAEIFNKTMALRGNTFILSRSSYDCHSSFLYYPLVYIYSSLFGGGKSLRILSVFFGILSLLIFYRLSLLFLNLKESLYALLFLALSPIQIWYAQEARGYTVFFFLSTLLLYFYIRALRKNKNSDWVYFTISGIVAFYATYFSILLLAVSAFPLLFRSNRRCIRKWFFSIVIIFAASIPLLALLMERLHLLGGYWLWRPQLNDLLLTFSVFNLGYSVTSLQAGLGLVLFGALFIYGIHSFYKVEKINMTTMLLFILFPIIFIYAFSIFFTPIYIHRQLLIFSPFYYLFVGKGLQNIKNNICRRTAFVLAIIIIGFSLNNYYSGFITPAHEYRRINNEFYAGIHPKKRYGRIVSLLDDEFKKQNLIFALDLPSTVFILCYLMDKQRADSASDTNSFVGLLFSRYSLEPHELMYVEKKKDITLQNCRFNEEELFCFSIGPAKGVRKIKIEDVPSDKIWFISYNWSRQAKFLGDGFYGRSTAGIKMKTHLIFKREFRFCEDGVCAELFRRRSPTNKR